MKSLPQNHLCQLTLLGNLVAKPEIRYQANPVIAVAEFVVATHSQWFDTKTQQKKEWTNYHTVKMVGDVVERSLLHANKGDIILIHGILVDSKRTQRQIIHATYAHPYSKGYTQSINELHCSGSISSDIKLVTTQFNKQLAEFSVDVNFYTYSPITKEERTLSITRLVHVWDKQAHYLAENGQLDDHVILKGKLNYQNNNKENQLIDCQYITLLKSAR